MKIAYVVLHYMAAKDTIECIHSILNSSNKSIHKINIIVVDNGSTNNSLNEIKKAFVNNSTVTILHSDKNLGFARGNNIGFSYAKNNIQANFIVLLNNDTLINQATFNEKIVQKFDEKHYFVLGPDIVTAAGFHQNPGKKQSWGIFELVLYRLKKRIRILLTYLHIDHTAAKIMETVKDVYLKEPIIGDVENTILHGACLIFSPSYLKHFDGICDKTFLYWEEDILKLQADFYGFLMMYSSDLVVYHKEDIATNMIIGAPEEKARRKYKMLIKSSVIYSQMKKNMLIQKGYITHRKNREK